MHGISACSKFTLQMLSRANLSWQQNWLCGARLLVFCVRGVRAHELCFEQSWNLSVETNLFSKSFAIIGWILTYCKLHGGPIQDWSTKAVMMGLGGKFKIIKISQALPFQAQFYFQCPRKSATGNPRLKLRVTSSSVCGSRVFSLLYLF